MLYRVQEYLNNLKLFASILGETFNVKCYQKHQFRMVNSQKHKTSCINGWIAIHKVHARMCDHHILLKKESTCT